MWGKLAFAVLVVLPCWAADAAITLGTVRCGQKVCRYGEYCSEIDRICEPCSVVCDEKSHNYEPEVCQKSCQDFLHDSRYVRKDGYGDDNLRGTVMYLSKMLTVTLTLVCIMLVILVSVFCFQLYRWKVKKNITWNSIKNKLFKKPGGTNNDVRPNGRQPEEPPPKKPLDLKLSMPSTVSSADNSPNTLTTNISRRPAEDPTLDYVYENPAMKNANSSF